LRADCVGGVFNHGQLEARREVFDSAHVARMTAVMDGNDSPDATAVTLNDKRLIGGMRSPLQE
jgi:hypothetical protein